MMYEWSCARPTSNWILTINLCATIHNTSAVACETFGWRPTFIKMISCEIWIYYTYWFRIRLFQSTYIRGSIGDYNPKKSLLNISISWLQLALGMPNLMWETSEQTERSQHVYWYKGTVKYQWNQMNGPGQERPNSMSACRQSIKAYWQNNNISDKTCSWRDWQKYFILYLQWHLIQHNKISIFVFANISQHWDGAAGWNPMENNDPFLLHVRSLGCWW